MPPCFSDRDHKTEIIFTIQLHHFVVELILNTVLHIHKWNHSTQSNSYRLIAELWQLNHFKVIHLNICNKRMWHKFWMLHKFFCYIFTHKSTKEKKYTKSCRALIIKTTTITKQMYIYRYYKFLLSDFWYAGKEFSQSAVWTLGSLNTSSIESDRWKDKEWKQC